MREGGLGSRVRRCVYRRCSSAGCVQGLAFGQSYNGLVLEVFGLGGGSFVFLGTTCCEEDDSREGGDVLKLADHLPRHPIVELVHRV